MSWVAAAVMGAGALGAGASVYNASQGGEMGYDMPTATPSKWDEENQRLSSEWAQQQARSSAAGELPPGMQVMLDQIKKRQLQQSYEQMYGRPGDRGGSIMDNTMSMGAMGGVGPKSMMSAGRKAQDDFASRNSQIMNYIDSLQYSGLQDASNRVVPQLQSIARSSDIPWTGQTPGYSAPTPQMDLGLGGVDWAALMQHQRAPDTSWAGGMAGSAGVAPSNTAPYVVPPFV